MDNVIEKGVFGDVVVLDGVAVQVVPPDLDGDGVVGGVEVVEDRRFSVVPVHAPSELGESLKEINKDVLENDGGMSGIDLRARIHLESLPALTGIDTLVRLGAYSQGALGFTRQWKRNTVSIDGKGREEMRDIVAGKKALENKDLSMFEKIKGLWSGKK